VDGPCAGIQPQPWNDIVVVPYELDRRDRRKLTLDGSALAVYTRRVAAVYYYAGDLDTEVLRRLQLNSAWLDEQRAERKKSDTVRKVEVSTSELVDELIKAKAENARS
jgi:hypothetical protein